MHKQIGVVVVAITVSLLVANVECGLTCLAGDDVPTPRDTNKVERCGPHEVCSLEQYITPLGFMRNKMECKDKLYCGGLSSASGVNTVICSECCDTDLCAAQLCQNIGYPSTNGPVCYHCPYPVASPMDCGTIKACDRDEFCGVNVIATGQYEIKCRTKDMCNKIMTTSNCSKCCTTQLCNSDCGMQAATCADDSSCQSLIQALQGGGQDLCKEPSFKHFCNVTCNLCPSTTTAMTSPTSPPAVVTSPITTAATLPITTAAVHACSPNPCVHGRCTQQGTSSFQCKCNPGYIGTNCFITDPCQMNPCQHGTCSSTATGSYKCTCDPGYSGTMCDTDTNECHSNPCMNSGTCLDKVNSFVCVCVTGFTGPTCNTAMTTLPPSNPFTPAPTQAITIATTTVLPCSPNPCVHGLCNPQGSSYQCTCNPGYIGANCDLNDPCQISPCQHGTCGSTSTGSFKCTCAPGYTGAMCDTDVNECHSNPCMNGGTCLDKVNSFVCVCMTGYTGPTCATAMATVPPPTNPTTPTTTPTATLATTTVHPCSPNPCVHGLCARQGSGHQCTCNPGYVGTNCDKPDPCQFIHCQHGTCSSTTTGNFICTCDPGYSGTVCDTDINECHSNPCMNGGTCLDKISSFVCLCMTGYTGPTCATAMTTPQPVTQPTTTPIPTTATTSAHPCSPNPCTHGLCTNTGSVSYQCKCNPGYLGVNCDLNDPCTRNPCQHGTCNSYPAGGFRCNCTAGYTGPVCDTDINECSSNPCLNGGTCQDHVNSFTCVCDPNYTGPTCDKDLKIRDCKDVKDMNIPSANNDAVYLIDVAHAKLNVKCEMHTDGGGWTVLLNRDTGIVDFSNKDSTDYALGFGDVRGDYWMGLEDMHSITSDGRRYQLRVEITDEHGNMFYEVYDDFNVGPGTEFKLHIGKYSGTAGDSLSGHNGFGFTTSDKDQDSNPINCANYMQGGWWFHTCYDSCLTCPFVKPAGTYQCRSMSWNSHGHCIALNNARMMVRPM